ncbi:chromosome segregation protein SMC [soil metagenome]
MKIKKLELCGFKSFVDRTIIRFDHDVQGIVGPNGCGKSNIVDAIRWCMGEQSAKHLRGRSMEDVLFNGSETRAGCDLAEVTLTFENNTPDDVPIEFKEYTDIAVTRRLHRNGDSEYLINKTQVRLKDITDLFLGTGVGTKAYSIVEQGKIGLIVSAKPEDRRILIEEAAGITKYKSRKKAAERKMELTQQNLLRVGDIVAEIDRNLGSLKRQAAKAERYVSYKQELEDLQLHDASHRYLELVGWTKLHASDVAELGESSERARTSLATREAELEGARLEAHSAEEVLDTTQNAAFGAENAVRAEEAAIDRAKDRLAALQTRERQAGAEAAEISTHWDRLNLEREGYQTEVATLSQNEEVDAAKHDADEAQLGAALAELQTADVRVTELGKQRASAQATIASAEATLAGFERRQLEMESRLEKVHAEREDLEGANAAHEGRAKGLERELEDLRSGKVTSVEERTLQEERLGTLRVDITGSERALDEAKTELGKRRSRLHALEEMHARLDGVGTGVKALVATKDDTIVGLVADRIEAPAELTAALAGLLGERLQHVVVRDLDRGAALLADLAAGKRGRATVIAQRPRYVAGVSEELPDDDSIVARLADELRSAPEDEALFRSLVGGAIVVRDVSDAMRLRQSVHHAPIVKLDGTVFHADGRIAGGTGEELAQGMLDQKREMRELAEIVAKLDVVAEERLAHHQALRAAIAETQALLETARHQAHADELALVTCEKDLRAVQTSIENVTKRLTTLLGEAEELSQWIQSALDEKDVAAKNLEGARQSLGEAEGALGDAETDATGRRQTVEERRHVVTESKVRVAGVREKLNSARGTLARLERSTEELGERKQRLEDELIRNAQTFGETAAHLMLHRETLNAALDTQRDAADALAVARTAYDGIRSALSEREALLKDLRGEAESFREKLSEAEMSLREKQIALRHLLEGVAEKFRGLALPRIIGDYHMRTPPDEDTRSRTNELVSLIDRMGSVNLEAMREHADAEERFNFYTREKADLDKALDDLERAIQQMNRESRRLFSETFEAVNAKFQELFPRMFRGGRASLRLTNPEDLLETGIDILAQPPGKKLSSIELMSGGEKALTAVSLIFSIFQIKPSPFCILDEVDAPLDEANVARYNDMIRSMTGSSQFILITHIKRTMQLVDVLYGVTMQESGVSRIVSVRMNAAGETVEGKPEPKKVAQGATEGEGNASAVA